MKTKQIRTEVITQNGKASSPLNVYKYMGGGRSHPAPGLNRRRPDAMIAVFGNRVTYTFILDKEVASIHFDRAREEIFFKGHNIRHLKLNERQLGALIAFKEIMAGDEKAKAFFSAYDATLGRYLADNRSRERSNPPPETTE